MNIVVDTNVLITFFWKHSVFQKILAKGYFTLYAPEYALEEINKYQRHILEKTQITIDEFNKKKRELAIYVDFIEPQQYIKEIQKLQNKTPDPKDIDFLALAYKLQIPLWTNDKELKRQKHIQVFTTQELLENSHLYIN